MKRFVLILSVLTFAALPLAAQQTMVQSTARYKELASRLATERRKCDSLSVLIVQARDKYATDASARDKIAEQLVLLEKEAFAMKKQYDKTLQTLTAYEQRWTSANVVKDDAAQNPASSEQNTTKPIKEVANLIYNQTFVESLSAADYKTLREAQNQEKSVKEAIEEYLRCYDKMVSIQLEYERVDTESAADSLLLTLDTMRLEAQKVESRITSKWQKVYDNKIYAYNLLMEKDGRMDVVSAAEKELSVSLQRGDENAGNYESDAMIAYYYRKLGLMDYETRVATALGLSKAKDSLYRVKNSLKEENFCLPKVNIVRRSFIKKEPLKVIKPIIYTSKNPIPKTEVYENGTVYRVRLGIFTNRPNVSAFRGITPLSYTNAYHNGKYAYFVGAFATEEEAAEGVKYLKKIGFRDPIVVMWVDGEYISNIAEWKSKNNGFNIEITGVAALSDDVKTHISIRNENCRFSRVGTTFIVGPFASKSEAELVASEITAMDGNIETEIRELGTK